MPPSQPQIAILVAIRAAHHRETRPNYDRIVFEFTNFIPLLRIEYVQRLIADGSGLPVPIAGNAIVQVQFMPAQAHNDRGQPTVPIRATYKLPTIKEIVSAGDFEAVVTYGVGLTRKAEPRIITLANPNRIVIDILQP
jgi:hypothetical protein